MSKLNNTSTRLFGHLMAYGASEAATKLSRLGVVVVVARSLDLAEVGIAAAALATGDLLKSLTENGVTQRIVVASDDDLDAVCHRAHQLNWLWCGGLFALQAVLAAALWLGFGKTFLALMILILGAEYLFMPGGLVQCGLALRQGKLSRTAAIAGTQSVSANVLSMVLAVLWPTPLALVLPRLLTAPIWLVMMRRLAPWRRRAAAARAPIASFLRYGGPVLGTEVIRTMRLHADKLLVGALLGPELLGAYFMAFNAGLSLASSFSTAFAAVLFPHLCASEDRGGALGQGMRLSLGLITPVVILQSLLAPWYVPLLLGPQHNALAEPVAILCLVAIPSMLWTATAGWMRATQATLRELRGTLVVTFALLASTLICAPYGLSALAWGYLATATLTMLALSTPALKHAFPQTFKTEPAQCL
ncbi:oligosaccharide flippase family protein [Celeribacter litoreus]|uniref:oligosaccharide flippase family protein n=1 Tax=Celeribacter litoreus TaxID=2876714 RepID=UPI001CC8F809|nr:oligosaccharide flippase family protein [Celeribacter litoreus]MCA0044214.1 oligosaccharide flippase family protein [Celeribacter litoreus]